MVNAVGEIIIHSEEWNRSQFVTKIRIA